MLSLMLEVGRISLLRISLLPRPQMDGALEHWIWKLVEALKSNPTWQINVIIADWLVSAYTHYPIAAQNTRDVGQEIAHFLEWLEVSMMPK